MSTPSIADATLGLGSKIGRHFGVVSMLPSLFLVLWTTALLKSDAWYTMPDPKLLATRMGTWSLATVAWVLVATLLVALFLHPLQFGMTQLLEGYWGSSRIAQTLIGARIIHHRNHRRKLINRAKFFERQRADAFDNHLEQKYLQAVDKGIALTKNDPNIWDAEQRERRHESLFISKIGDPFTGEAAAEQSALDDIERYPPPDRIMPTRLGNALRSVEDKAGSQYGLDAILTAPHLTLVAAERHIQYLRDSRQQMDTTVQLCTVSLLATVFSLAALVTDGWWLTVALGPYSCFYLAYRASISAAVEYTAALSTVIDLNRFTLYESLRIDIPRDTEEERAVNIELMALLDGDKKVNLQYAQPAAPARKRRTHLGKDEKPNAGIP